VPERRLLTLVILGALSALAPLSMDMYLPGLPALARDLGTATAPAQLTLTACLLGIAAGQLVGGPLSDAVGRRRPLLLGLAAYAAASAACALAPSVATLVGLRFLQGLAGGTGIVISRAVVRDRHAGVEAARYFGALMLVNGLAPILAPSIGGLVLHLTSWRGVFAVLTGAGGLLWLGVAGGLPESLPPARRHAGGLRATLAAFGALVADRVFVGCAAALALAFAAMFTYISGSPFVLQGVYGVSPQVFGLLFGVNAVGIVLASQAGRALVRRVGPERLLAAGVAASAAGGLAVLLAAVAGAGLGAVLVGLFVAVSAIGLVIPNATALALAAHERNAGSASGLLGVAQFVTGAAAAPLVGIAGDGTAIPMGAVMAALGLGAVLAYALVARPARAGAAPALR
jgi:MFS transporter, DHA1 family, multidrug resistance protein